MPKWFPCLLLLASTNCGASGNLLDFDFGRGLPVSWVQAGGSSDRAGSLGTAWSADLLHNMGRGAYLGLGGGQSRSNDNVSETFVPGASSTLRSKYSSIFVLGRTDLSAGKDLTPYLIGGLGWVKNSLRISTGQQTILDESHDTLGYLLGAGLDWPLTSALFVGAEVRYQTNLKRGFDLTSSGQAATGVSSFDTPLNNFTYSVKAGIKY